MRQRVSQDQIQGPQSGGSGRENIVVTGNIKKWPSVIKTVKQSAVCRREGQVITRVTLAVPNQMQDATAFRSHNRKKQTEITEAYDSLS